VAARNHPDLGLEKRLILATTAITVQNIGDLNSIYFSVKLNLFLELIANVS